METKQQPNEERKPTMLERVRWARYRAQGGSYIWLGRPRGKATNFGETAKFTPSKTPIRSYERTLAKLYDVPRKTGRRKQARIEALNAELTSEAQALGLYEAPEQDAAA